jgi:hypothetical protein
MSILFLPIIVAVVLWASVVLKLWDGWEDDRRNVNRRPLGLTDEEWRIEHAHSLAFCNHTWRDVLRSSFVLLIAYGAAVAGTRKVASVVHGWQRRSILPSFTPACGCIQARTAARR